MKNILKNMLCAFFVTAVFSFRWLNCLPFSGYMPLIRDPDTLRFWTKYIFYVREPFSFPLGLVKGLSFPFHIANISNTSIPIFVIPLKFLSKIYAPLSEFYYFPLAEMIAVFTSAYFTYLLLDLFKVKRNWIKFLGVVIIALSHSLLYRSSHYYGVSFTVAYFPTYLAFAYFFVRLYKNPCWRTMFIFSTVFPVAALIEPYVWFGIIFLGIVIIVLAIPGAVLIRNKFDYVRLRFITLGTLIGISLSFLFLFALGQQGDLKISPYMSPLDRRYNIMDRYGDSYGGGLGGGFHVADILSVFIPPKDTAGGFPLTTAELQRGQYEGFAYVGTVPIIMLVVLIVSGLCLMIKNFRRYLVKFSLKFEARVRGYDFLPAGVVLGLSAFLLYVMSWGYIIHIGGIRFNDIPTPSLLLALIWPKFMFVRSLGRLAIPFSLYITMGTIVWFDRFVFGYIYRFGKAARTLVKLIILTLIFAHICEIRGYLDPPRKIIHGNDLAYVFGNRDKELICGILRDKKALLVVPASSDSVDWGKICYAMAFYANIPLSGATVGTGVRPEHEMQFNQDIRSVQKGRIKEIFDRYGDIAIATTRDIGKNVLEKTDMPLKCHELQNRNAVILTLA